MNEHLERLVKNAEASTLKCEHDLSESMKQNSHLQQEKNNLIRDFSWAKKETQTIKEQLLKVIKEKDNILVR